MTVMKDNLTISLRELQRQHTIWERRNFPDCDLVQATLGVNEEAGELSHAVLKRIQKIRGDDAQHAADIRDACADIIIYLTSVADHEGFDLAEVVTETWEKVRARDWNANPHDGQMRIEGTVTGRIEGQGNTIIGAVGSYGDVEHPGAADSRQAEQEAGQEAAKPKCCDHPEIRSRKFGAGVASGICLNCGTEYAA